MSTDNKRPALYDGDTFTVDGFSFRVKFEDDTNIGPPWLECDGHGPVRQSRGQHRNQDGKRPGERPLNDPDRNQYQYYYDWQKACELARVDGWNAEPFEAPGRVLRAVQSDFDFLRAWVNDKWRYVGVIVERLNEDEEAVDESSLWGVESFKDYHVDVAYELAGELISKANHEKREALNAAARTRRAAKKEAGERAYWASRDVETIGA